jgi:hypothetical protein
MWMVTLGCAALTPTYALDTHGLVVAIHRGVGDGRPKNGTLLSDNVPKPVRWFT